MQAAAFPPRGARNDGERFGPLPQIIPYDPAIPAPQSPWVQGAGALHRIGFYFALLAILALHVLASSSTP
jgi:hypothetical protein